MDSLDRPAYPHRRNPDGSFDSICPECFATIARAQSEVELVWHERNHRCKPEELERFRAMRKAPARAVEIKKTESDEELRSG